MESTNDLNPDIDIKLWTRALHETEATLSWLKERKNHIDRDLKAEGGENRSLLSLQHDTMTLIDYNEKKRENIRRLLLNAGADLE